MKKRFTKLAALVVAGMLTLTACGGGQSATNTEATTNTEVVANTETQQAASPVDTLIANTTGTVTLDLWCSETEAYQTVMAEVVEEFKATYPTVDFNIVIGGVSEADAKDRVLEDVEAAADVFVFADDQINDLVKAGALQEVATTYTYNPAETNNEATVGATMVNGKMYAYPLTASNGYFLYYDSRYITPEQAQSWETLVAAAEEQGLQVGMDMGNAWYLYAWYAGAGCNLTLNEDGSNSCDWNNETGLAVSNRIMELCSSDAFISIGDADAQAMVVNADNKLVAYVDGTWAATSFQTGFADGYAATKLPTYDLNGTATQMGSYAGYKLVGVNAYSDNTGWAMLLAEFITNEASQAKIGPAVQEAPANVNAAANEAITSNVALKGLAEQSPYSDRQVVGGNFWTPAATLGSNLFKGEVADVQAELDTAVAGITQPVAQ